MKTLILTLGLLLSFTTTVEPISKVRSVPFKILNPSQVYRTRSHSIGLAHWGKDAYHYNGKIKFDNIIADGDFDRPPLVVLKCNNYYYFICVMDRASSVEFQMYDNNSTHRIQRISCQDVPLTVLTYKLPDDFSKASKWQKIISVYILRNLLRTNQKLCQIILRHYLSNGTLKTFQFLGLSGEFSLELSKLAAFGRINPDLKNLFFQDIQDIIKLGLTELHERDELVVYFFILCCLDYPKAAAFSEEFCYEYKQLDRVGKLKLYNYSFSPGDPNFPKGADVVVRIKDEIAHFDNKLKSFREYWQDNTDLVPLP